MSKQVQCAKCGFLAVRMTLSQGLGEVREELREQWQAADTLKETAHLGVRAHEMVPRCFRRAYPLSKEVGGPYAEERREIEAVQKVIQKERLCTSFTEWEQGFTPKEHQEVINAKELRALEETARKSSNTRVVVLAGIFTLLGAVIGVAGSVVTAILLK